MIKEVKVFSSIKSAVGLLLDDDGRAETDLIQVRDIQGLDPVVASIGTVPAGSIDGELYVGSSVSTRNIVLTLHPNPDWGVYTPEYLRRFIYSYFMPKQGVRLVFYSDDMETVDILGFVESCTANMFSKDPEYYVSIICPDPYFRAVNSVILTGETDMESPVYVEYAGNVPAGIEIVVEDGTGPYPDEIVIQVGDSGDSAFKIDANNVVTNKKYFHMSSNPIGNFGTIGKYIENIYTDDVGAIKASTAISLLSNVTVKQGSEWPMLQPGENPFTLTTDDGVHTWTIVYFARYGGL